MKIINKLRLLYIVGTLFMLFSAIGFSFVIPNYDGKINDLESKINNLKFSYFQINQAQVLGQLNFNMGKMLTEINPKETEQKKQLLQDSIEACKGAIISAHYLKYGKPIRSQKELYEKYPASNLKDAEQELGGLLKDTAYLNRLETELQKEKERKRITYGFLLGFLILGSLSLSWCAYYKEY